MLRENLCNNRNFNTPLPLVTVSLSLGPMEQNATSRGSSRRERDLCHTATGVAPKPRTEEAIVLHEPCTLDGDLSRETRSPQVPLTWHVGLAHRHMVCGVRRRGRCN